MANAWKQYTQELYEKFRYFAAWEPGKPMKLGDIGVMNRNLFTFVGNLSNLNIAFNIRTDPGQGNLTHVSAKKVNISFKAAGKPSLPGSVLGQTEAGVTIEFNSENSTVFELMSYRSEMIENQLEIGKKIIQLYKHGQWNKEWVLITDLISADSGTILISAAKGAKVELSFQADARINTVNLADASLGFKMEFMSNMNTKILPGDGPLTPLFQAKTLKNYQQILPQAAQNQIDAIDITAPVKSIPMLQFLPVEWEQAWEKDDTR